MGKRGNVHELGVQAPRPRTRILCESRLKLVRSIWLTLPVISIGTFRLQSALRCLFWLALSLQAQAQPERVLVISDIHFDPLANKELVRQLIDRPASQWSSILRSETNAPWAPRGHDSNYSLLSTTLKSAAQRGPFDYVIFEGDALRHDFQKAFVSAGGSDGEFATFATKTAVFVVSTLEETLRAPVILAIGNNDSACGDYRMDTDDSFFQALSNQLHGLSHSADALASFQTGGYYSIPDPAAAHRDLIVLNSVLWSPKYAPCKGVNSGDPGQRELDWLEAKLDASRHGRRTALIVMHIPPGADVFGSLHKCAETPLWKSQYVTRFSGILQAHKGIVQFALSGHVHRDDFRLITADDGAPLVPIRGASAVSPVYGNDPEFSVLSFSKSGDRLTDMTTYSLALSAHPPEWRPGDSFFRTYGISRFDSKTVAGLVRKITGHTLKLQNGYLERYALGLAPVPAADVPYYTCALTTKGEPDYGTCVCRPAH